MALNKVVKAAVVAICLLPVSFQAQAISRYTSTSMSCAAIAQKIRTEGAAIFRWTQKPDILRYGLYVADDSFCSIHERAMTTFIPSADAKRCAVLECKPYDPRDDLLFPLFRFGPR